MARLRNRTLSRPAAAFLDALLEYDRELVERDALLLSELSAGTINPRVRR
jgi:hypothetical protein